MLRTLLRSLRDRARVAGTMLRAVAVTLIRGSVAGGSRFSLLYSGSARYAREFELLVSREAEVPDEDLLFRGSPVAYLAFRRDIRARAGKADVVVRQAAFGARQEGEFAHVPFLRAHLHMANTLAAQIEEVRSKAHRRRMRSVVRSGEYAWTVSAAADEFEVFFDRMYAPYVQQKFGRGAHLASRAAVSRLHARAGRTLLVYHRGEPVCGSLLLHPAYGAMLVYHLSGFAGGERWPATLLATRTAALEIAVLEYALREGFRSIDFGITRAVLNDGLFVHKRRLGCSFIAAPDAPTFFVRVRSQMQPSVLASFPLLAVEPGGFVAHLGYERNAPPRPVRRWRSVVKNYPFPQLRRAILHTDAPDADPDRGSFETALRRAMGDIPLELVVVPERGSGGVQ